MTMNQLALVAHLLGVVLWVGGMVTALTVAAASKGDVKALGAARKATIQWATPGLLLAWAGGLGMLIPNFGLLYATAGWMHAKLTVAVVLTALTGVATGRIRKAAAGTKEASGGLLDGLAYGIAIGAMAVIALAGRKPC